MEIAVPSNAMLRTEDLTLTSPAQVNRSMWTGRRKVIGLPGVEIWSGTVSVPTLNTEAAERPWRAFLFGLRGPQNTFRWMLPCNRHPGEKPTVAAGAGNGYTLPIEGAEPNVTLLKAGQFMTVPLPSGHHRPVVLVADLVTDAAGEAIATFEPALNEVPATGATVETVEPFIVMSRTNPEATMRLSNGISGFTIAVEEAM